MIKDICGIKVKNEYYNPESDLMFFNQQKNRLSIIYGRNGSGKSTLSRIVYKKRNNQLNENEICCFLDKNGNGLSNIDLKNVYIYGEDFIKSEIKFSENKSLNAIVMLGEQTKIDEEFKKKHDELDECIKANVDYEEELKKFDLDDGEFSLSKDIKKINDVLKKGWAIREKEIKGNKKVSPVKDDQYIVLLQYENSESPSYLNAKLKSKQKIYNTIVTGDKLELINKNDAFDEKKLFYIINRELTKPISNKQIELIYSVLNEKGMTFIETTQKVITNKNKTCPICYQKISDNHLMELKNNLKVVLNNELSEFNNELNSINIKSEEFDFSMYRELFLKEINEIEEQIITVNDNLSEYNNFINQKQKNPYNNNKYMGNNYYINKSKLDFLIDNINIKIKQHNDNIDNKQNILSEMLEINKKIAYLEIKQNLEEYNTHSSRRKTIFENKDKNNEKIETLKKVCKNLEAKKKNINLALDKINQYLQIIFLDKNRLNIELNNYEYTLNVRGNPISLDKLSQGEKNAISLCYFFVKMLEECAEKQEYHKEYFVILDDPISSFDNDNKIGMYSLFRYVFEKLYKNNSNTKIITLTHKLDVYFDIKKVYLDIDDDIKWKIFQGNLINKKIELVEGNKGNEYSKLVKVIFDYAFEDKHEEYEMIIGNIMRRVLEAYATFNYNMGFDKLCRDNIIIDKIEDQIKNKYFSTFMYRLVLNTESHLKDQTYNLVENKLYDYISQEEKIQTARSLLSFLRLLDEAHLIAYEIDVEKIKLWEDKFFTTNEIAA